jgi:hypothetical protein
MVSHLPAKGSSWVDTSRKYLRFWHTYQGRTYKICSNICTDKYFCVSLLVHNGLKWANYSYPLHFKFTLEYAIRKFQSIQKRLELYDQNQMFIYTESLLCEKVSIINIECSTWDKTPGRNQHYRNSWKVVAFWILFLWLHNSKLLWKLQKWIFFTSNGIEINNHNT